MAPMRYGFWLGLAALALLSLPVTTVAALGALSHPQRVQPVTVRVIEIDGTQPVEISTQVR